MITVELLRDWRHHSKGQRIQRITAAAEVLVARGIGKIVGSEGTPTRQPIAKDRSEDSGDSKKNEPAKKKSTKKKSTKKK